MFEACLEKYVSTSKPEILTLDRNSCITGIVMFRRFSSHDVSSCESADASRTEGAVDEHLTVDGVYPSGESGSARARTSPRSPARLRGDAIFKSASCS